MYLILWHASADFQYQMLGECGLILSMRVYLLRSFPALPIAGKSSPMIVCKDIMERKKQLRIGTYCLVGKSLFWEGFFHFILCIIIHLFQINLIP